MNMIDFHAFIQQTFPCGAGERWTDGSHGGLTGEAIWQAEGSSEHFGSLSWRVWSSVFAAQAKGIWNQSCSILY